MTSHPPRRILSALLMPLGVILMLLEEYLWRGLKALMARLGRLPVVARVEARIIGLSPPWAAVVFLVPGVVLFPFKLAALWAIANGHILWGLLVLAAAKLTATALFARLYTLCKPTLMTVGWFVRLHDMMTRAKLWAHAKLESWGVWRLARRAIDRLRSRVRVVLSASSSSSPSTRRLPLWAARRPPSMVSRVVLPEPEGPVRITISPACTLRLMSVSTCLAVSPSPNQWFRCCTSIRSSRPV